jgi:hypothetical protein
MARPFLTLAAAAFAALAAAGAWARTSDAVRTTAVTA